MLDQKNSKSGGRWCIEQVRDGKVIATRYFHNDVVNAGKNYALDCFFGSDPVTTQIATWYAGLINNTPTPTYAAADTLASHAGWVELACATTYTGNRQPFTFAAAASGVKTATAVSFPILLACTIAGIMICSAATGTSGTLWSTAQLVDGLGVPAPLAFNNGDTFRAAYAYSM